MTQQDNASQVYTVLAFCFVDRSTAGEVLKELKTANFVPTNKIESDQVCFIVDLEEKIIFAWHGRNSSKMLQYKAGSHEIQPGSRNWLATPTDQTQEAGNSAAHNNMPPYYGVLFIKRTARLFYRV